MSRSVAELARTVPSLVRHCCSKPAGGQRRAGRAAAGRRIPSRSFPRYLTCQGEWETADMVLFADTFASWLIGQVADAGRKGLTTWVLGSDQERALRKAAEVAVQRTAEELRPEAGEQAAQIAMVVDQIFVEPMPRAPMASHATLAQALQAGIAGQLAPLGDAKLTGTPKSSPELL